MDISQIFAYQFIMWPKLQNFRSLAKIGLEKAENTVHQEQLVATYDFATNPAFANFLNQNEFAKISLKKLSAETAKRRLDEAYASIDAAAIVFTHTVADAILLRLVITTSLSEQERWENEIKDKSVKIADIKGVEYEEIRQMLISKKLEEIEGKSLLYKADLLYRLCQPIESDLPVEKFKYERGTLEEFDVARHDIVHGRSLPHRTIGEFDEMLKYVEFVCMHFILMVDKSYQAKIDFCVVGDYFKRVDDV